MEQGKNTGVGQRERAAYQEAGNKAEQGKNTEARQRKRAANQEAGDKAEQLKNTEAGQKKRSANQEAGDKAEQGKNTEAGQRKRAGIREGAKWESSPRPQLAMYVAECSTLPVQRPKTLDPEGQLTPVGADARVIRRGWGIGSALCGRSSEKPGPRCLFCHAGNICGGWCPKSQGGLK